MADVQISYRPNGPYLVKGPIELKDEHGNAISTKGETTALCRCGGSETKPFCDGTHSKIGFQGATAAVKASES